MLESVTLPPRNRMVGDETSDFGGEFTHHGAVPSATRAGRQSSATRGSDGSHLPRVASRIPCSTCSRRSLPLPLSRGRLRLGSSGSLPGCLIQKTNEDPTSEDPLALRV